MAFEYLFKEFGPDTEAEDIRDWLKKIGEEEWEAVGLAPMQYVMGGGMIGGISLPSTPRFGYTFLMKREKKN
jgi:hypothetical protein